MRSLVLNRKESARLLSSDFRSENPLTQTRTFHTQNRYLQAEKNMENPLKCPDCSNFRTIIIKGVRWEKDNKSVGINVPFFKCPNCDNEEPMRPKEYFDEI